MAGMHLPGADCLLHSMRLRFIRPIVPPASLIVEGKVLGDNGKLGRAEVTISDASTASRYVEGGYEFSHHDIDEDREDLADPIESQAEGQEPIVVTGASGGLGRAVVERLGARALGVSRATAPGILEVADLEHIADSIGDRKISGIVHCAWPAPDNQRLTSLANIEGAVEFNVAAPLRQTLALARLLQDRGTPNAMLVLVGSTAAYPGRHNYRMPLYTLSKSLISTLTKILAVEMADSTRRCVAVTFDVIAGGMNGRLSPGIRAMHADRAPSGALPSLDEAAGQIEWTLENRNFLVSGATIDLTGAAIP
jgi:NAD(P)-dependent dehydrogenase (short-subunit alcohol dehydrogenase family)